MTSCLGFLGGLAFCVPALGVDELEQHFATNVRPFVENHCLGCHDADTKKAELDLSGFKSVDAVVKDFAHWELVLERLRNGDMPPRKAKNQPTAKARKDTISWLES